MTGESNCTTPLKEPIRKTLHPDSLVLLPKSKSNHSFVAGSETADYQREFRLAVSRSDSTSAFPYFDSSGFSLFADSARISTPAHQRVFGGMGQCSYYQGMEKAFLGDTRGNTKEDTTFTLRVEKDGLEVRSWKVEYAFESANPPEARIVPSTAGLAASIAMKPGAEIGSLWMNGAIYSGALPYRRSGDTLRVEIVFNDILFLRSRTDSASVNRTRYNVCVQTESGYESIAVDGATFPSAAVFCWQLAGENHAKVTEYVQRSCYDCK